MIINTLDDILR